MSTLSPVKDDNFCLPIPDVLETPKLKLVPFNPALHAEQIFNSLDESSYTFLPFGPYTSAQEFVKHLWEENFRPDTAAALLVGLDKTRPNADGEPAIAGLTGYVYTNVNDLWTELFVIVLPGFRGSHVASQMVGLLLRQALDLPSAGGWGMRRVQWAANVKNTGSIKLAKRIGMQVEGIKRWARVLPKEKAEVYNGRETRKGDPREDCPGRDSINLAICWDDWERGGRANVEEILK